MTQTRHPENTTATSLSDEERAGRRLLRKAFMHSAGLPWATHDPAYPGCTHSFKYIEEPERPVYWYVDADPIDSEAPLPFLATERDVKNISKFLAQTGVETLNEKEDVADFVAKRPWEDGDLVRVYGREFYPYPEQAVPVTIAALPHMREKLWDLVRYNFDPPEL